MSELVPDRWLVLSIRRPPTPEEALVADGFLRLGSRILERKGERLVGYVPPPRDLERFLGEAEAVLRSRTSQADLALAWEWRSGEEARAVGAKDPPALRVSPQVHIVRPGVELVGPEGAVALTIDPGLGFGSGTHGTTRASLRLIERRDLAGRRVVDVGAGCGILSIACARFGAREVLALERDTYACAAARRNAELNGVLPGIEVREEEVRPGRTFAGREAFHGAIANLEPDVLFSLLPDVIGAVRAGGWLIVSGAARPERRSIVDRLPGLGVELIEEETDDGWWAGALTKLGS